MKENKYDNDIFFEKYSQMNRSQKGLEGAGEWSTLEKVLPDFENKRVLDLGCGFGWHCLYAIEKGANSAVGLDISEKMLQIAEQKAKEKSKGINIEYQCKPIEEADFEQESFDIVLSSLAFHYVESFDNICKMVNKFLTKGGQFVFSVEHPVFTAEGSQQWCVGENGKIAHWAVDNYFYEGKRCANFLGEEVTKYHKTLTTYLNGLLQKGFEIKEIIEPMPDKKMLEAIPEMKDEMRRPMMLIVSAVKK